MQIAGSASWVFEETGSQMLDVALYTRDAANLAVNPAPDIPPSLSGEVARRGGLVSADKRDLAAQQWMTWWRRLLDQIAYEAVHRSSDRRNEVFDPPDFHSLARMPALRSLVTGTYIEGRWWFRSRRPDLPEGDTYSTEDDDTTRGGFSRAMVRDTAELAAAGSRVPLGDLRAVVHVLAVDGLWSHLAGPGCAICSPGLAADPDAARQLLREVFGSSPL